MAKYQISNIKIKPVGLITNPDGTTSIDLTKNPNKDRSYAVMDLINKAYAWDTPKIHTMFEPAFVEMLKPYVSKADGGTSDEGTKALPAHLECISGAFVEWIAPVPFYKRYLTDQDPIKPSPANPNGRSRRLAHCRFLQTGHTGRCTAGRQGAQPAAGSY